MRKLIVLLALLATPAAARNPLPADASSVAANGLCSAFHYGGEPVTYWDFENPEDVRWAPNRGTGMWEARTDLGSWQPIPNEAITTTTYPFGFILYVKELRGAVHVGCFNPPPQVSK